MITPARSLRTLLAQRGLLVAPGAYDCITAMLIEQAGFPLVYMTGAGTAAAHGFPDYGLITLSEMVENAGRIARAIGTPLISDADTGYGNAINVFRTVREFEARGVAAIHIEDQLAPKKCGHLEGKELVSVAEYTAKIRAAAAARRSPDFVIIARTDARAVTGFDDAVARGNAALEAGADMVFLEAPQTLDEIAAVPKLVNGPCLLNVHRGGKTPEVDLRWVEEVGYRIAIAPGVLLKSVIGVCDEMLKQLQETKVHPKPTFDHPVQETFRRFGADAWDERRRLFGHDEPGDLQARPKS